MKRLGRWLAAKCRGKSTGRSLVVMILLGYVLTMTAEATRRVRAWSVPETSVHALLQAGSATAVPMGGHVSCSLAPSSPYVRLYPCRESCNAAGLPSRLPHTSVRHRIRIRLASVAPVWACLSRFICVSEWY